MSKRPETYEERYWWLKEHLNLLLEAKHKWLAKQEIGGLKENGISLMEERYHQGYLSALRDTLDTMKVLVQGDGKPTSIGKK